MVKVKEAILALGILILVGLVGSKIAGYFKLPAVTGYILFGLVTGPSVLGLLGKEALDYLNPLNDFALALIALTIGYELKWQNIKKLGKSITSITVLEASGAVCFVFIAMLLLKQPLPVALIFAAISSATAPAATVAVIREYNTEGPLTRTLLAVVALDDAYCILATGVILTIIKGLVYGAGTFSLALLTVSFLEIAGSLLVGALLGLALNEILKRWKPGTSDLLGVLLGTTLLAAGLSIRFHLSPLLTNMVLGSVLSNISPRKQLLRVVQNIEGPIYTAFFTLAGASLELEALGSIGLLGFVYVVARFAGKYTGAWLGGKLSHAQDTVNRYLGLALMPQAGVAIGLSMMAAREFPELGGIVINVVLAAVVVYELLGPVVAKYAFVKAGEIQQSSQMVRSHPQHISS